MFLSYTSYFHLYIMILKKNIWGEKTDWVGKELTSQFFPRGKNWLVSFFPGEKTGRPILSPGKKLTGEKTDRHTGKDWRWDSNFFFSKTTWPIKAKLYV